MPPSRTRSIGRAGPNDSMAVADVAKAHDAEVVVLGTLGTRPCDLAQRIRKRPSKANPLSFVYEAGPWGAWRYRDLMTKGDACGVVAPALIPKKPGARVTTDRRDAGPCARRARSGDLTGGSVPKVAEEAIRALTWAREDTLSDLPAATCRLNAVLLHPAIRQTGRATWGPAPLRWLADVGCPTPAQPIVLHADVRAIHAHTARLPRLDHARHDQVTSWRVPPVVEARQALRGVQVIAAVTMVAARGDLTRFEPPRALMQGLGRIPSAYSTGERRRQGAMTTAGHPPARRALVAGAWAYRAPANVSRQLPLRLDTHPKVIQDSRWTAQVRLCQRYRPRSARGKHANVVTVAMARELAGVTWALAKQVPVTP